MSTIVPNAKSAQQNIMRFEAELASSLKLQKRLANARAWYALQDESETWHFAPSKFCGYKDMTAAEYVNDDPRDGRQTENQLKNWFTIVTPAEPLYDQLNEALTTFLDKYDKLPNSANRIAITNERYSESRSDYSSDYDRALIDLIITVGRGLSANERARIKAAL